MNAGAIARNIAASCRCEEPTCTTNNLYSQLRVQSDEETIVPLEDSGAREQVSQTVRFLDNATGPSEGFAAAQNKVAIVDSTEDLQLGEFFSRPTLINTFTWSTGELGGVKATILPWYLFLNNVAIKKKLDNFAFLRGNLHIKTVLNGTPFQYGFMRACYSPLLGLISDKIRTNVTTPLTTLIPYSQQPGFWIQPQANAGGEMTLPFFLHKNWLDVTSATEVQNMGTLNFVIFSPLYVAVTGGSSTVTVQTYAWLTDLELMASTANLSLQGDEYVEGSISGPATVIAKAAAVLSNIPIIRPFARATEIGARAVSGIARLFGYTNAPVIAEIHGFHPMNAPMLASAHISVPSQKLTIDPKQELSIDPAMHGLLSEDELSLTYLKRKESFFGSTSWATTDTVNSQLFNVRVNPMLMSSVNLNNSSSVKVGTRVYHVPLSYIGNMFAQWRGTIKIRVKVVASKFHKGRLKIQYDPRNDITTTAPAENTVYTQIMDIGEQDDITLTIPYHQDLAWLDCDHTLSNNWTVGNTNAPRIGTDNGVLSIRVLTNLTAPSSGLIYLLFFVSGGDDFEFANPSERIGGPGLPQPSFFALQGEEHVEEITQEYVFGTQCSPSDTRYALNFGECIASLRNILHRSSVRDTVWLPDATLSAISQYVKHYRIMPPSPGYDTSAYLAANKIIAASGTAAYHFAPMHPMSYIANMFLGYRGGASFTITPANELAGSIQDVRVLRGTTYENWNASTQYGRNYASTLASATSAAKANFLNNYANGFPGTSGMAITATHTNTSLLFNLPDNKKYNFSLADPYTWYFGSSFDETDAQTAMLNMLVKTGATQLSSQFTLQTEQCAGPDFTCLFFLCCPTLDVALSAPTTA
jgi:hypothetical protein